MSDHIPVMLNEVLKQLGSIAGKTYIDCTFGAGGYTKGIIEQGAERVYAIDCDPDAVLYLKALPEAVQKKITFINGNFSDISSIVESHGIGKVDGVVMDLGISSMQVDKAERGFSFNKEAKLDMRMSQEGYSAYELVNQSTEKELSDIIYRYGDEINARKIAKNIVLARATNPISTTIELANIIRSSFLHTRGKIDLATKAFQAIRICVNNELNNLKKALGDIEKVLNKDGRLVVVTFHSLEDVIVKQFIRETCSAPSNPSRYIFEEEKEEHKKIIFKNLTKKVVEASYLEVKSNPRSRSAKLRAIEKIV